MPEWLPALIMAEVWGVPPWIIEEQATEEWVERWRCLSNERAEVNKPKEPKKK